MNKEEIRKIFSEHGVALSVSDTWAVQGTPVVKHAALERLAAHLGLTWDMPREVIATMTEVVILARATRKDGIAEWSYGECNVVRDGVPGGNYKVSGKQPGYPFAMAEKRAKDRVILKLAGLHGAYSEEEADDFNARNADADEQPSSERKPAAAPKPAAKPAAEKPTPAITVTSGKPEADSVPEAPVEQEPPPPPPEPDNDTTPTAESDPKVRFKAKIDQHATINDVTDMMLDSRTVKWLSSLPSGEEAELRDYAKARLTALGWPNRKPAAKKAA